MDMFKKPDLNKPSVEAHVYNPSYSGGKGRKIKSSRPAPAKLGRPCLNNKMQAKGLGVWPKSQSTDLSCTWPWVQSPEAQTKQKNLQQYKKTYSKNYISLASLTPKYLLTVSYTMNMQTNTMYVHIFL
jgi:hypothetical protein